jgi:methionine-rich copper-binding protein CopC
MTNETIIAYLLEELTEDDLERFEDECFAQESWPTEIELAEEDMIDAYLRNELLPERRQRFEQNYLTTDARHERVSIAAALLRHIDDVSKPVSVGPSAELTWAGRFHAFWNSPSWGLRAATAIGLVVVFSGALWLLVLRPSPPTFAALTLSIRSNNRAEGAQADRIKLPPNAEVLNISLILPQPSPPAERYRVELENDNGDAKSAEVAEKNAQTVFAVVPAAQLARGQYVLKLFAIKPDGTEQRITGSYFFIVE